MTKPAQSEYPIDFVLLWVDDSDPEWKKLKDSYSGRTDYMVDNRDARYRDWDTLKYWFRGVEKFAPWVNKIYFVTCGHVPEWLNLKADKLVHIKHADYIPEEYLPTFSSHTIELNLNRIGELSEHFVYFNDDTFICRPVSRELFYRDGKPVHQARLHAIRAGKMGAMMPHIYLNTTEVINEHFDMQEVLKKDRAKWFSLARNGAANVFENLFCSKYNMFPGFGNEHLPVPILKSTMDTVWKLEGARLDETCRHRFRDVRDVSQFVFRYWQLASGNFVPEKIGNIGACYTIKSDREFVRKLCGYVTSGKYNLLCLNDADALKTHDDFLWAREQIERAFNKLLPEKCSFEK